MILYRCFAFFTFLWPYILVNLVLVYNASLQLLTFYVMYISERVCVCLVTQSCPILCDPMDCSLPGSSIDRDSPGKNTGVGCHALPSPGDLPNPGIQLRSLHRRGILYHLSHQGSPRTLEWVAYLFSRGSSRPRHPTGISCIAGKFFTNWAIRKAHLVTKSCPILLWPRGL